MRKVLPWFERKQTKFLNSNNGWELLPIHLNLILNFILFLALIYNRILFTCEYIYLVFKFIKGTDPPNIYSGSLPSHFLTASYSTSALF